MTQLPASERLAPASDNLRWRTSRALLMIVWLTRFPLGQRLFERAVVFFYRLMIIKVLLKIGVMFIKRAYLRLFCRVEWDAAKSFKDLSHIGIFSSNVRVQARAASCASPATRG